MNVNKIILDHCGETNTCGIYKIEYKNSIYIGQTTKMGHRQDTHLSALRNNKHDNGRLQNICNKYGIGNLTFSVIEFCGELELTNREQFWADFYQEDKEYDVLNMGEFVDSAMRGRNHTQKTKEKISNSKRGVALSEKHKRNIGKGNEGKVVTRATREKISRALKGKKGKPHSVEWKNRNSKLQKGRIKSNKECENIRKAKMGHKVSIDTKKKISKSLKLYCKKRKIWTKKLY